MTTDQNPTPQLIVGTQTTYIAVGHSLDGMSFGALVWDHQPSDEEATTAFEALHPHSVRNLNLQICPAVTVGNVPEPTTDLEPTFWYRPIGTDGGYEGPHRHTSILGKMMRDQMTGQWKPLYEEPQPPRQHLNGFNEGVERAAALVETMFDDDGFPLMNRGRIASGIRALATEKEPSHHTRMHDEFIEAAFDLSTWAACINWRGKDNEREWLDELREHIDRVQKLRKEILGSSTVSSRHVQD
jgi:hypothetical protein